MRSLLWVIFVCCLVWACWQDLKTRRVYNLTWGVAAPAAVGLSLLQWEQTGSLYEYGIFALLQILFFGRTYGKADRNAFLTCGICIASVGGGLKEDLLHMLIAYLLLGVVQGAGKNIARNGNLKEPVPFLPYITLAFFFLLWYHGTV